MRQLLAHKHYYWGAAKLEIIEEYKGKVGYFAKGFFTNDKINGNDWKVTWEAIKKDSQDLLGIPIVRQYDMEHPSYSVQKNYARGYVIAYELYPKTKTVGIVARFFDKDTWEGLVSGKYEFVSPAVIPRDSESIETINGVDILHRFIPLHLAIVKTPAYGKIVAKFKHLCQGTGDSCMKYFAPLTASALKQIPVFVAEERKKTDIQSVIFDKDKFTEGRAKNWLKEHGFKIPSVDETEESLRFRQEDPDSFQERSFRTIALTNGIKAIIGRPAGQRDADSAESTVGPLTQIPLIKKKKLEASINYLASKIDQLRVMAPYPVFEGKQGEWINARDTWVFVAKGESVDESIKKQCPCLAMKFQ